METIPDLGLKDVVALPTPFPPKKKGSLLFKANLKPILIVPRLISLVINAHFFIPLNLLYFKLQKSKSKQI